MNIFVIFIPEYVALYSFGSFIIEFQLFKSLPFVQKFKLNVELLMPFIGLIQLLLIVQFLSIPFLSLSLAEWNQLKSGVEFYHQCNNSKWHAACIVCNSLAVT